MSGKLMGTILQAGTKQPIPARVYVTGSDRQRYYPTPSVPHPAKRELEGHVITLGNRFEIELPAGTTTVRIERGPEWIPHQRSVEIPIEGAAEVVFELKRWINLAEDGWYSGDLHVHRRLADMHALLLGEDVNVAMPLTYWEGRGRDPDVEMFAQHAGPAGDVQIDDRHLFTIFNQEHEPSRSPTGAVLLMGMNRHIDGHSPPPLEPLFDLAHQHGGFVDMEKHSWAWAPIVAAAGKCDAFELANNHHWREKCLYIDFEVPMRSLKPDYPIDIFGWTLYGFDSWYAYLNCGFKMAPIAGTANGVHPNPLGHSRVYVQLGQESLSAKAWQEAMLAGRSFVTTGPILFMDVNGHIPGNEIRFEQPSRAQVRIRLQSLQRPERIEIIRGGDVVHSVVPKVSPRDEVFRVDETVDVEVATSTYIAARVFVEPPDRTTVRFAHSGVVRITIPNKPLRPRPFEVVHFARRVESMIDEIKSGKLKAGDPAQALGEYERALAVYRRLEVETRRQ